MTVEVRTSSAYRMFRTPAAAVFGALLMVLGAASGPALAQPSETRERAAAPGQGAAHPRPPAAVPGTASSPRATRVEAPGRPSPPTRPWSTKPWSIEDALPDNSPAARERIKATPAPAKSAPEKPALGRVPLQNGPGTFGVETETKVKSTEFPDGRPVPGVETSTHRPPSYFGLSISVPTNDKSIIPAIPAPFGKSDKSE